MWWYMPLAYNPDAPNMPDFRGAIYANVVNATWQLLVNLPGTYGSHLVAPLSGPIRRRLLLFSLRNETVSTRSHDFVSVASIRIITISFPPETRVFCSPFWTLRRSTNANTRISPAISVSQDFPYQYANFRQFLSTLAVYVNTASTGARGVGAGHQLLGAASGEFFQHLENGAVSCGSHDAANTSALIFRPVVTGSIRAIARSARLSTETWN